MRVTPRHRGWGYDAAMRLFAWLAVVGAAAFAGTACGGGGSPAPTPVPTPAVSDATPFDYEAYQFSLLWPDTDFSKRTVSLLEIISGGVSPDGIPPLDAEGATSIASPRAGTARFVPAASAGYPERIPVTYVVVNGEAKAYPLHILTWHEVVNDVVGGVPVVVTFCPLCNTALAFERTVGETVLDFGVSGLLRNSDLIMWDRQTKSWWQQALGEAIVGTYAGTRLRAIPAPIVSFGEFLRSYPGGAVLSENTGVERNYGINPYDGYDRLTNTPFLFTGEPDPRLPAMERVVGLDAGDGPLAVPFSALESVRVVHADVEGRPVAVFWAPGTATALGEGWIPDARDIGSATVFYRRVGDRVLEFERAGDDRFRDRETGSIWTLSGLAVEGPLAGTRLEPAPHQVPFWFAWAAFHPETRIWQPE